MGLQLRRATTILGLAVLLEAIQFGRVGDLVTALFRETPLRPGPTVNAPADAPDIYLLLLDGYARHDILDMRFGLDDTPFLDGLRARGFTVAAASHSNYIATIPSLSSFLNYRQLVDVPDLKYLMENPGTEVGPSVHRAISQAAILDRFHDIGYETVAVALGLRADSRPRRRPLYRWRPAERLRDPPHPAVAHCDRAQGRRSGYVLRQPARQDRIGVSRRSNAWRARADPTSVHLRPRPQPTSPVGKQRRRERQAATDLDTWYFDTPESTGMSRQTIIAGFDGQTAYIGARALKIVDRIIAASPRPPVVIFASDHGPSLDVSLNNVETRLRNLFAAHTPGHDGMFADDVTLVNVFPSIFEAYFGVALPRATEAIYGPGPRGMFDPVVVSP